MRKQNNDNWKLLLQKLKEDDVSTFSEKDKLIFIDQTSSQALIYNLFKGNYKFSYNDFYNIFKELTNEKT